MIDIKMRFSKFYEFFVEPVISVALPSRCEFCGVSLPTGRKVICESCFNDLPLISHEMTGMLLEEIQHPYFDHLYIRYQFGDVFQKLIHHLKYNRSLSLARYFAGGLSDTILDIDYDIVTAVPLHPIRFRERGYNQSSAIARHFASVTGRKFRDNLIIRTKYTQSQTKLNKQDRIKNVGDAFRVTADLSGGRILIIDDVITTGSTLNSCASDIKRAGALKVDIAALATPVDFLQ